MAILALVLTNLLFNIFMWVWELIKSQLIEKTKQVVKLFFFKVEVAKIDSKDEEASAKSLKSPRKDLSKTKSK